jgi:hypothetical protein
MVAPAGGHAAAKLLGASPDDLCEVASLVTAFGSGEVVLLNFFLPSSDGGSGRKSACRTPEQILAMGRIPFMIEVAAVRPLLRGCGELNGPGQSRHAVFSPVGVVRVENRLHGLGQRICTCGSR